MTKLLTTPVLRACEDNDAFVGGRREEWWFCISALRNIFDLPDVKKVWLEFHDTSGVNRCHVQVLQHEALNSEMIASIDGTRMYVAGFTGRMIANRLKRTWCYVECKFEEEVA